MPISPSGERVAITLGDPAGIGPEVALKALVRLPENLRRNIMLLGPASFYSQFARKLKLNLRFAMSSPKFFVGDQMIPAKSIAGMTRNGTSQNDGSISCFFEGDFPKKIVRGQSIRSQTVAAVHSIRLAVKLAMKGTVGSVVTPPIHKAGLKKAGFHIPGHTEYLAELSGTRRFEMMLVGGPLRVVLVTRHVSIKEVPGRITGKRVEEAILLTDQELRKDFGIKRPRLVVCGLNPHAGEAGTIGREEQTQIAPAVRSARRKTNARIIGPLSADVLFHDAYQGRYDAEICMYHDQGLIPLKMISRGSGVNVTLGLPFIRTSPDHGTGYDIAGKFIADPGSMHEALILAIKLLRHRSRHGSR